MAVNVKIEKLEIRTDENDMLMLEITCEKLLNESKLLTALIANIKSGLPCLEEYEAKKELLVDYVNSDGGYEAEKLKKFSEKLVNLRFYCMLEKKSKNQALIVVFLEKFE